MTIICYKDGVLAADSNVTEGDMAYGLMRKIIRSPKGILAGAAGDASVISSFLRWVALGMKAHGKPKIDGELDGMIIRQNGAIFFFESNLVPFKVSSPFHAAGSGQQMGIGAMAADKSAVEAVAIVCQRIITCGGPLQALRLDGAEHELDPTRLGID